MRKIYSLSLAAVVAVAASGMDAQAGDKTPLRKIYPGKGTVVTMEKVAEPLSLDALENSEGDVSPATEIEGKYLFTVSSYFADSTDDIYTASVTIDTNEEGKLIFECYEFPSVLKADYDATTGEVTFLYGDTFTISTADATYYTRCEPVVYGTEAMEAQSYSVKFENGRIAFPENHGFAWPVYETEETLPSESTAGLSFGAFYVKAMTTKSIEVIYQNATWTDNIYYPHWFNVENPNVNDVEVGYIEELDTYLIKNPFHDFVAFLEIPEFITPELAVYAADPTHCRVAGSPSGIVLGDDGMHVIEDYEHYGAPTDEQLVTLVETENTITITFPYRSMMIYTYASHKYYWGSDFESKLVINKGGDAGVDGVEIDNPNAPVEYFNLQGVKVAEPSAGLYIVRQGNKVTKQVIR